MCEISRLRYLSSRERTDRSFQTDEQAKPARPEVGTASGAFSARPRKRPRWVAQAPSAAPRDARRRPGPRPRASASSPAPRPPRRARRSAPPRGRRGRDRRLRRARPRWRVAVNDCGGCGASAQPSSSAPEETRNEPWRWSANASRSRSPCRRPRSAARSAHAIASSSSPLAPARKRPPKLEVPVLGRFRLVGEQPLRTRHPPARHRRLQAPEVRRGELERQPGGAAAIAPLDVGRIRALADTDRRLRCRRQDVRAQPGRLSETTGLPTGARYAR